MFASGLFAVGAGGLAGSCERGRESSEAAAKRKWTLIAFTVDFYDKQVNAIDFVSAGASTG